MKKLITIILALALLLPAAALAVTGDSPFFGEWAGEEHHVTQFYDTMLHYVFIHRNTPCAYFKLNMRFGGLMSSPKVEEETMYDSNWEIVDDHIRIPTSGISYIDLYYDKDTDTLYCKDPKVTFVRIP